MPIIRPIHHVRFGLYRLPDRLVTPSGLTPFSSHRLGGNRCSYGSLEVFGHERKLRSEK